MNRKLVIKSTRFVHFGPIWLSWRLKAHILDTNMFRGIFFDKMRTMGYTKL